MIASKMLLKSMVPGVAWSVGTQHRRVRPFAKTCLFLLLQDSDMLCAAKHMTITDTWVMTEFRRSLMKRLKCDVHRARM